MEKLKYIFSNIDVVIGPVLYFLNLFIVHLLRKFPSGDNPEYRSERIDSDNSRIIHHQYTSKSTQHTYPVHVYLPEGYVSEKKAYPVIYMLDGQWSFDRTTCLDQYALNVIFVSIEQGGKNRRMTDYLWPGAKKYYAFLMDELIPDIEQAYHIDTHERTLVGTSAGGMFCILALLMHSGGSLPFKHYVAFDGVLFGDAHRDLCQLETKRYAQDTSMQTTLYLTSTNSVFVGNKIPVNNLFKRLARRNYSGLRLIKRTYPGWHAEIEPPSFEDMIKKLFLEEEVEL